MPTVQRNTTLQPFDQRTPLTDKGGMVPRPQQKFFTDAVTAINAAPQIQATVPANSAASGTLGDIAFDHNFFYLCVGPNLWRRAALTSF